MKYKNCIFLCIIVVLLFSCNKKKENNSENVQQETEKASLNESLAEVRERMKNGLNGPATEKEIIKEFIYTNDEYIKKENKKIIYIEKANFGIPGGDNWIVLLNNKLIFFYAIGDNEKKKDSFLLKKDSHSYGFILDEESEFNIIQDIPGTHIGNTTSSFGDYNGDSIDEIFEYGFFGWGSVINIWSYDKIKDKFVSYCEIPFEIIDSKKGPAPVEFLTYKGMYGFKVYYSNNEVAGGIGWVSDPDPNNGKWIFYTWDTDQRKYVEIGEVVE